jgi:DNA-binding MarR family transcriptional regulator
MMLAQIPEGGILERRLAYRLGMTLSDAAQVRGELLRRRLLRREPAGRSRATSRLYLTERGREAARWLEQLQSSLSPDLFETGSPAAPEFPPADSGPEVSSAGEPQLPPWERWLQRWRSQPEPAQLTPTSSAAPEDTTFERGLLYVWLGTGLFVVAVTVGVLWGSEISGLTALGLGFLIALIFLALAAIEVLRRYRHRARSAGRLAALWAARPGHRTHVQPTDSPSAAH